jgi:hypothetical protein
MAARADATIELDVDGCQDWSGAERLFGWTRDEAIGTRV